MEAIVSEFRILADLQGRSSCPDFNGLTGKEQIRLEVEIAERVGFASDTPKKQGHASMTFDGQHPAEADMISVADCSLSSIGSALLFGTIGTGKTAMLSAMLKYRFRTWAQQTKCKAYILPALFLRRAWFMTHDDLNALLFDTDAMIDFEFIKKCDLLIIDEFMAPSDTKSGWHMSKIEQLINHRWECAKDTWLAMNLDPSQIKRDQNFIKMHGRFVDIAWMSVFRWTGKNRRLSL